MIIFLPGTRTRASVLLIALRPSSALEKADNLKLRDSSVMSSGKPLQTATDSVPGSPSHNSSGGAGFPANVINDENQGVHDASFHCEQAEQPLTGKPAAL